jgi:hypothetical protein
MVVVMPDHDNVAALDAGDDLPRSPLSYLEEVRS